MSKESEFTFRMGDHEVTMRESFAMMYQAEQLFDCALVCHQMFNDKQENKDESNFDKNKRFKRDDSHKSHSSKINIVKAHKVVLASSSDYFQNLFSSIDKLGMLFQSLLFIFNFFKINFRTTFIIRNASSSYQCSSK